MKSISISTNKGNRVTATVYEGEGEIVLIISSATGVKQGFYSTFSSYLQTFGITVITFDYQGIGNSLNSPIEKLSTRLSDWGMYDLDAVIQFAKSNYSLAKITLLGHSIGGQLVGFARSSYLLDRIILVASQSGYWNHWEGMDKLKMWIYWHVFFPSLSSLFKYFPSKSLSRMENLPKQVAMQWSSWGRSSQYFYSEFPKEGLFFKSIESKITSISIDGDDLAPKPGVDWLTKQFSNAKIKRIHFRPEDFGVKDIGHFGMFRNEFQDNIWKIILAETLD